MSVFLKKRVLEKQPKALFGLVFVFTLLASAISLCFNNNTVSAYSASISNSGPISTSVTPKNGGTGTSISTDAVNVTTNCRAGYNLTIAGPNDRNLYKDGNSANNTSGQYFTPVDGTSQLKNTTNAWGYSLTANTDTGIFTPLPNTPTPIRTPSQTASETDIDDDINIYYGVSVTNTLNPGSYTMSNNDTIVYQLTMDMSCNAFTVSYNANGGTGTMEDQDIVVGQSTKLTNNTFTAPAKGQPYQDADGTTIPADPDKLWVFWGWNTEVDGTGDWYKNTESVLDLGNSGDTITLYAQWKQATLADLTTSTPVGTEKTIDHNTMQDMSAGTCWNSPITTAADAPAATLTDSRGGTTKSYNVSKLADELCWMTTNLALGSATDDITLTSDNTDLADNTSFTLPAADTVSYITATNLPKVRLTNNSGTTDNGAYYTWNAATANTALVGYTTITTSICPKNWDLPTSNQYTNLKNKSSYSSSNPTTAAPSSFLIDGGFTNGASFYQTSYSHFWTANSSYTSAAYGVRVSNTAISTSDYTGTTDGGNKYYRKNIRCIASQGIITINYNANNGSGSTSTQSMEINSGKLASASLFPAGSHKQFKEWNTAADGTGIRYTANTSASSVGLYPGQSLELYAIWYDTYEITFVNTDTWATQTKDIIQGQSGTMQPSTTWTKMGYKLMGWDTNSSGTNVVYTRGQSIIPTGDMTVYTVWEPSYTIQYDGNGADAGVMTNVKHTNVTDGDVFDLFASNYSKTNYGFAGWSFDQNAQPGGASRIYGPNEVITAPAPSTPGETKTLYAVWVPAETGVYMQTWNDCSSMSIGDVIALKDQRDNNVYTVGKLVDGNCWMMENLRLNNSAAGNSDGSLAQGYAGAFVGLASPENTNFSNSTTANSLYSTTNITGSNQAYRFPRFNYANTNTRASNPSATNDRSTATSAHSTDLIDQIYSYGNYYTWSAAMANTNNYIDPSTQIDGKTSETVGTSICPKGWKLPYGGGNGYTGSGDLPGGFYYLGIQLGATTSSEASSRIWRSYPYNFIYSGSLQGSSVYSRGSTGTYWTSTAQSSDRSYYLSVRYNQLDLKMNTRRYYGGSVRCLLDSVDIFDLTYMQDFNDLTSSEKADVLASMTIGAQYQLEDERDGKDYYISKLADGNVWMTQNLDFDIVNSGADLNSTNTDVPSNWTDAGSLTNTHAASDVTWDMATIGKTTPQSYDPGDLCWNGTIRSDYSGTLANSTVTCASDRHYHMGNYYSWNAAVAMANSSSYTTSDTNAGQSICPAGWTLPKSGSNTSSGSFAYLLDEANITSGTSGNIHTSPYYFIYSGDWSGSSRSVGGDGSYWSSTVFVSDSAYNLFFARPGHLGPDALTLRAYGYPVRCIVK